MKENFFNCTIFHEYDKQKFSGFNENTFCCNFSDQKKKVVDFLEEIIISFKSVFKSKKPSQSTRRRK